MSMVDAIVDARSGVRKWCASPPRRLRQAAP
jgi:hypothetical protein